MQSAPSISGGKITAANLNQVSGLFTPGMEDFLDDQPNDPANPNQVKAYLNWILFDEQMKYVSSSSSFRRVADGYEHNMRLLNSGEFVIPKNGYLFVYVSNESANRNLYFDNLVIHHSSGPLLEESHYYPFGLMMAGISSSAAGTLKNKYKFGGKELNSNEFSNNSGIEAYDFGARNYDQQIGRWWNGDPKADKLVQWSPYVYCVNNPLFFIDPNGEYPYPITIRSFHPAAGFGGGGFGLGKNFSGDNRGFSNVVSKDVSARVHHTVTADPEKGTLSYSKENTYSSPSHHPIYGEATDKPVGYANKTSSGNGAVSFETGYAGDNPLVPSPEINVKSFFTAIQTKDMLTISVNAYGDDFPNTEMFVADPSGQTVFLGVDVRAAAQDKTPTILFGGANENIINTSVSIKIDDKGNFVGVVQGDKTYSLNDWNERFKNANPNPKQ